MSRLSSKTIEAMLSTFVELDEQGCIVKPDMPDKVATALQHEIHQAYRRKQKLAQELFRRISPVTPSV